MPIRIKAFVLSKRLGTELCEPVVFPSFEQAYEEMEKAYYEAIAEYDEGRYYKDESYISGSNACIVTSSEWEEWEITETDLEINDLHGFTSAFREYLAEYSAQFEQFMLKVPQASKMAAELTGLMLELKGLLSSAGPGSQPDTPDMDGG